MSEVTRRQRPTLERAPFLRMTSRPSPIKDRTAHPKSGLTCAPGSTSPLPEGAGSFEPKTRTGSERSARRAPVDGFTFGRRYTCSEEQGTQPRLHRPDRRFVLRASTLLAVARRLRFVTLRHMLRPRPSQQRRCSDAALVARFGASPLGGSPLFRRHGAASCDASSASGPTHRSIVPSKAFRPTTPGPRR
jgi:hypothetical protein